jgi:hypothetical protein
LSTVNFFGGKKMKKKNFKKDYLKVADSLKKRIEEMYNFILINKNGNIFENNISVLERLHYFVNFPEETIEDLFDVLEKMADIKEDDSNVFISEEEYFFVVSLRSEIETLFSNYLKTEEVINVD